MEKEDGGVIRQKGGGGMKEKLVTRTVRMDIPEDGARLLRKAFKEHGAWCFTIDEFIQFCFNEGLDSYVHRMREKKEIREARLAAAAGYAPPQTGGTVVKAQIVQFPTLDHSNRA